MNGLKLLLNNKDFEFGSKNYDDDFHTDVVFYRASCSYIKEYVGVCHDEMIAFHKKFNSTFYYSRSKTKEICDKILSLLINDENFYKNFEKNYRDSCKQLSDSWNTRKLFSIKQYEKQYFAQQEVYKTCWPFEIIQTEFGIENKIIELMRSKGFPDSRIKQILYSVEINTENVYYCEKIEINNVCDMIKQNDELKALFKNSLKHIVILMPANLRDKINCIVEKYKYLYYHGYSDRKLPNIYDYVAKIKENLMTPIFLEERKPIEDCNLDIPIKRLLYCYGKLSALKSIRRLAQLKNFYYLDNFIATLAEKKGVSEAIIRCMTPEEVICFYKTGKYSKDIERRIDGMIYLYQEATEYILVNEDLDYYEGLLNKDSFTDKTIFEGKVACRGYAKGKVTKLLRRADAKEIGQNNIIFTHEGDPDLLPVIKNAGAIVCEQGGVTCHMAIIAREYGIPCVIGIGNNIISKFQEGDIVEVNAIEGYIKRSEL